MEQVRIDKVVVHMGVGEAGDKLVKAENIMKEITGQQTIRTIAKLTQPAFNVRKGQPIGCKVFLRGKVAEKFFEAAIKIVEYNLSSSQFDNSGNFSFGIEEHTDFPGQNYDPRIGIYGMDVNVILEKPGVRIARRAMQRKKLPASQRVSREEAINFVKDAYKVEVE